MAICQWVFARIFHNILAIPHPESDLGEWLGQGSSCKDILSCSCGVLSKKSHKSILQGIGSKTSTEQVWCCFTFASPSVIYNKHSFADAHDVGPVLECQLNAFGDWNLLLCLEYCVVKQFPPRTILIREKKEEKKKDILRTHCNHNCIQEGFIWDSAD